MTIEQRAFVDKMIDVCEDHNQWLAVVRFGLPTLLEDQAVLWKLIVNEAKKMTGTDTFPLATIQAILRELLLHLEVM